MQVDDGDVHVTRAEPLGHVVGRERPTGTVVGLDEGIISSARAHVADDDRDVRVMRGRDRARQCRRLNGRDDQSTDILADEITATRDLGLLRSLGIGHHDLDVFLVRLRLDARGVVLPVGVGEILCRVADDERLLLLEFARLFGDGGGLKTGDGQSGSGNGEQETKFFGGMVVHIGWS